MKGCQRSGNLGRIAIVAALLAMGCGGTNSDSEYRPFSEAQNAQEDAIGNEKKSAVAVTELAAKSPAAVSEKTNGNDVRPTKDSISLTAGEKKTSVDLAAKSTPKSDMPNLSTKPLSVGDPTALEAIRRIPNANVAGAIARKTSANVPSETPSAGPRKIQLLIPKKDFRIEGPEEAVRVTYDDIDLLKVLNMEPVIPTVASLMPPWLKALDGKRIRIRGFMYPAFEQTGLTRFGLARDNQICCFGKDPKIYDLFPVKLREGVTTRYIENRPFDVVGIFRIRPYDEDGKLLQLYRIDDAIVIEK